MGVGLRDRGGILLISAYELGHQPMGLATATAFLRRAGFEPSCVDTSITGLDEEPIRRARLIAISAPMHTALRLGIRVARRIRRLNPGAQILFFGNYAWLNRNQLLGADADFVLAGESERRIVELATGIEEARIGRGESPAFGSAQIPLERLDFPVPERAGLPGIDHYARLRTPAGEFFSGYVEASRGCRYQCSHCPIPPVYGGRFFVVPREVVLADAGRLIEQGARHITFGDADFLNAPRHSLLIVKELHEEFPAVSFDFTAKVEHLVRHSRLLPEFARAGCVFVVTAAESLNNQVLRILRKGHTRRDIESVVASVTGAGIVLRPSWVSFTPWTTLEDYLGVFSFAEEYGLVGSIDPIQYAIRLLVPPGSPLANHPEMRPHLRGLDPEGLSYRWRHPDLRMDLLHDEVSRLAEGGVAGSEDPAQLFRRFREAARSFCSPRERNPEPAAPVANVPATYGLTEPWFC